MVVVIMIGIGERRGRGERSLALRGFWRKRPFGFGK